MVGWAAKHGIGVIVDLHGAPGSQNGQHHSGVSDGQTGLFSSPDNVKKTISLLEYLTSTFVNVPNVVGIQLLNEPLNVPELYNFYNTVLDAVRSLGPEAKAFPFYLHDAFNIHQGADYVRSRGSEWTVLDRHSYFVFTPDDNAKPASAHSTDIARSGDLGAEMIHIGRNLNGNLITGEWSCALSYTSLAAEVDSVNARRVFCESQQQTYVDAGSGYHFWSYKKENCDEDPSWCFREAVGNALPSTFFSYDIQIGPQNLHLALGAELSTPLAAQSKLPAPGAPPIAPSSKPSQQMVSGGKRNSGPNELHGQSPIPKNKAQDTETQTHEESSAQVRRWHSRDHKAHKIHEHRSRYRLRQAKDAPDGSHIAPSETIDSTIQDTSTKSTLSLSSKPPMVTSSRTASSSNSVPLSPAHQAIQRGFSDGFMTAKLFAQQGPAHGSSIIVPGKEGYYREWFDKGLVQGEMMVAQVIERMNAADRKSVV